MKKIIIEEVKVGVSEGGMACGPVPGHVIVEARIRQANGKVSYYGLVEVDGTANFYATDVSRYEKEIADEIDEDEIDNYPGAEGYMTYDEFYEDLEEMMKKDKAHALLLKYLVCLARLDWDGVDELKEASVGKAIGDFEIPVCDAEEEYLEENSEDEFDSPEP